MSQVAVASCPEGIVIASESLVSYERGRAHGYAQKVHVLGPRLAFAAVGNATMPDPRTDSDWPGFAAHLETLTGGEPIEGDPGEIARRIGRFAVDVLQWLTDRPRGWEGLALATWHMRYAVAGYAPDSRIGTAVTWTATAGGAHEDGRITTEGRGRLALGVFDVWPPVGGRQGMRRWMRVPSDAEVDPPDPAERVLDRAERAARRVVSLACRRWPTVCGGPLQVVRIEPDRGLQWTERPEWVRGG